MRTFNAFQITAAFVAWPFFIAWIEQATFRGAAVAFWSAIAFYVVAFFMMVGCVHNQLGDKRLW